MVDICNVEDTKEFFCSALNAYATQCAKNNVILEWRKEVPECGKLPLICLINRFCIMRYLQQSFVPLGRRTSSVVTLAEDRVRISISTDRVLRSALRDVTVHVEKRSTKTVTAFLLLTVLVFTKVWNTLLAQNTSKETVPKQIFGKASLLFIVKFQIKPTTLFYIAVNVEVVNGSAQGQPFQTGGIPLIFQAPVLFVMICKAWFTLSANQTSQEHAR
jgi:C8 domain